MVKHKHLPSEIMHLSLVAPIIIRVGRWGVWGCGGGGGNSFANITLAISSRCFSILLLSLGAFHKVLDLRANKI